MISTRNGRRRQGWLQLFGRQRLVNVAVRVVEWRTEQRVLPWGCRCLIIKKIIVIALGRSCGRERKNLNRARREKK